MRLREADVRILSATWPMGHHRALLIEHGWSAWSAHFAVRGTGEGDVDVRQDTEHNRCALGPPLYWSSSGGVHIAVSLLQPLFDFAD